jgi:hypothetical protein
MLRRLLIRIQISRCDVAYGDVAPASVQCVKGGYPGPSDRDQFRKRGGIIMKIIYDVSTTDACRMDAIIISEDEFQTKPGNWKLAFRGDDRPPSVIFNSGFKKRTASMTVRGAARVVSGVGAPMNWSDVVAQPEWGPARWKEEGKRGIPRTERYSLQENEIRFRPNHLDLQQETCISLTRDFELTAGFPLTQSDKTYSYIVKLPAQVLPTYLIQQDGGNAKLAKSFEVTCNEIPAAFVVGAAEVERAVDGTGSIGIVKYSIKKWWVNVDGTAFEDKLTWMKTKVGKEIGKEVPESGTKEVVAGLKTGINTASNAVLRVAVLALSKHITIQGGLQGTVPGAIQRKPKYEMD